MKKNVNKRRIEVSAPTHMYLDIDFFCGKVTDVLERVKNFIPDHKEFINNLKVNNTVKEDSKLDLINDYEFHFDKYSEYPEITVKYFRDETDEEYKNRIEKQKQVSKTLKEKAKKIKIEQEREERELYEELKKKYG